MTELSFSDVGASPYVYALLDGDRVFYVGKGRKRRMYQHALQAENLQSVGPKSDRIRAIHRRGDEVGYKILGIYETDGEAFEAERVFISAMPDLTNIASGGGVPLGPKAKLAERARILLEQMVSLDEWVSGLAENTLKSIQSLGQTPTGLYNAIRVTLAQEAASPSPVWIATRADGVATMGWA